MESSEALRETIMTMSREVDFLRTETTHANLLLNALDTVLCVDSNADPFAEVFSALLPIFAFTCAIVLVENNTADEHEHPELECVAASETSIIGTHWKLTRLFNKVLSGRIISTVDSKGISDWPRTIADRFSSTQPALIFPLAVREHRGLVILIRKENEPGFDRSHVSLARKFSLLASHAFAARQASLSEAESHRLKDLTEKLKSSQEALRYRANHDELTGLPNRFHIQELVSKMIDSKPHDERLALAFVDLDEFKRVNDLYGHVTGDALLREVALRLQSEIRPSDVAGRISGDEFVIALDPVEDYSDTSAIIDRLQSSLQQPLDVNGTQLIPSASIGIAVYPSHGPDYETLRRHADIAMYRAKLTAKGSTSFFTRDLGREADERLTLEKNLHDAIASRGFHCALQKKVDIRSGEVTGFEILARWVDSEGRIRSPGEFLPLASELGLLDEITMCVLDDLIKRLPELDGTFGPRTEYSLNISPSQTTNVPFMTELTRRLAGHNSQRFFLELTEEALSAMDILEREVLPMLRSADIRLSIDDFGTGYSSLSKLAALTVDELKVDMSLMTSIHDRPRNQVILRAIESLGSALEISIVAEGIESAAENEFLLQNTAITIGQGFLFHKPQLLDEMLGTAVA